MPNQPIALQRQDASGTVAYFQQVAAASNGANRMPIENLAKHLTKMIVRIRTHFAWMTSSSFEYDNYV
jgi:hypothetical protein